MIDRRPAVIVQANSTTDVAAAIKLARSTGLPLSVRGGGHGVAGNAVADGGIMIDCSSWKDILVDAERREATAAPGLVWGEFDAATQAHQLATTGGQVSHTGIAGLTLGGGFGYLMGKHGAVCDNLLSVEIVTADGEVLTASEEENAELFWAVRGAGANFGIVTSFRYRLHPLGQIIGGMLLHPRNRAQELFAFHREFLRGTPDELDTTIGFLNSPDGMPLVGVIVFWAGDIAEGERLLEPLRKFGPPVADLVQPMPYSGIQTMVDNAVPVGNRYYWKSNFASDLHPALAATLEQGANAMPSPYSMVLMFELKGKLQRVPKDAMAFDHRDHNFEVSVIANWTEPQQDAANIQWTRDVWSSSRAYLSEAVYANHMTNDETPDRVLASYGPAKYEKLAALKAKYDPTNLFRPNSNITPKGA